MIDALKENLLSVKAVVFDCHATNVATANKLGAAVSDLKSLKPHFSHNGATIHIIFDVCHVLKLMRNLLADEGVLRTPDGQCAWKDIRQLYNLQRVLSMRLANKLTKDHVNYEGQKMKVKLAAQTLSNSVATALELLRRRLVRGFQDVGPLVTLLRTVDELFDR